ncbi:hypothetical protein [Larkinella punicea]|uniref:hypothetical protein n=1 Tax=Larkinella punicea TaxID=2315727 RepID=UPI0010589334|nr:hypothetical protein [Larkinella punicea]
MILPNLPVYITIPDQSPSCEICGCRGEIIAYFQHTNYKGSIYDCLSADQTHRFIDREDEYFSIDYWNMSEEERRNQV